LSGVSGRLSNNVTHHPTYTHTHLLSLSHTHTHMAHPPPPNSLFCLAFRACYPTTLLTTYLRTSSPPLPPPLPPPHHNNRSPPPDAMDVDAPAGRHGNGHDDVPASPSKKARGGPGSAKRLRRLKLRYATTSRPQVGKEGRKEGRVERLWGVKGWEETGGVWARVCVCRCDANHWSSILPPPHVFYDF
jgi:hypothetical protein